MGPPKKKPKLQAEEESSLENEDTGGMVEKLEERVRELEEEVERAREEKRKAEEEKSEVVEEKRSLEEQNMNLVRKNEVQTTNLFNKIRRLDQRVDELEQEVLDVQEKSDQEAGKVERLQERVRELEEEVITMEEEDNVGEWLLKIPSNITVVRQKDEVSLEREARSIGEIMMRVADKLAEGGGAMEVTRDVLEAQKMIKNMGNRLQ